MLIFGCDFWFTTSLFVLKFYGPVNPMGSCRAQSVYLTTRLLGRLSFLAVNQYCAHSFTKNWQLPFLDQRKGENDHRKYFMINLHIQLSHRGRRFTTSIFQCDFYLKQIIKDQKWPMLIRCLPISRTKTWRTVAERTDRHENNIHPYT